MRDEILIEVFARYGTASALAARLGVTRQSVSAWKCVPMKYVKLIEKDTGIPRDKLRPDVYGN